MTYLKLLGKFSVIFSEKNERMVVGNVMGEYLCGCN